MVHVIVTKTMQLILLYYLITCLCYPANANLNDITSGDPPYNICAKSNNYATDSPFKINLYNLFGIFSSNASVTKFSSFYTGDDSDRVYGLYMCFSYNYTTYVDCSNCIATMASQHIVKYCPNKKEAIVWEDSCLLHYSSENFFGKLDVTGNIPKANSQNVSDPASYRSVVNRTLSTLTNEAAFNPANDMSATGVEHFSKTETLYALVQCTRDLSGDDCSLCLQTATREILSCCYFLRGARVHSRSCFLRYELYDFSNGATDSSVSAGNQAKGQGNQRKIWMIIILTIVTAFVLGALLACTIYYLTKKKGARASGGLRLVESHDIGDRNYPQHIQGRDDIKAQEFYVDLKSLHLATDNFSDSNMLGQGGFGPVYKGIFNDGKEVAVKRLSSCSEQGTEEFTNEVLLILKLQHKNLVRLLGFCVDGEEKLLVYEFMPNSSLDVVLFDPRKRTQLSWSKRLNIINGIAKGILYLHVDSRFRIVHRDLKASNILLDSDMNPKISDFGMARIFAGSEGEANTARIVGTYGYMAPEYAMEGLYSIKSDVFSFGVLLIEIITGRRNAGFHQSKRATSLLAYAWQLWNEGNVLELMDPLLGDTCLPDEFLRYIHIGLLCVQEDAFDRPTMSSVVVMLKGETVTLRQPERPAFSMGRFADHYEANANNCSANILTVSDILPR
ncbi:hypothetical protein ACOSQ4_013075 [Xanthoceras sorbifolium]